MSHECKECGEEFDSERGLHIHQSQKHSDEDKNHEAESNEDSRKEEKPSSKPPKGITLTTKQFGIAALIFGVAIGFAAGVSFNSITGTVNSPSEAAKPDNTQNDQTAQISGTPEQVMKQIAEKIGADKSQLASCMNSSDGSEAIRDRNEASEALGKVGTPTFLVGNSQTGFKKLRGAQPYSSMKPVIEEQLSEAKSSDKSIEDDEYTLENMSLDDEPSKGESDAPIRIVEISDYACPWCAEWAGYDAIPPRDIDKRDSWNKVKDNHINTGEAEFIYKDYPAHRNSRTAHKAANCIEEQGGALYWKFHDKLFEYRDSWTA